MLTRPVFAIVLVAALASACLGTDNSINAYAGQRSLEADEWNGVDEPTVWGFDGTLKLELPWTSIEGGWLRSEDDTDAAGGLTDVEVTVDEYFIGVRIVPWKILIEPYAAAGISMVEGDFDADNGGVPTGDSDSAFGYYARLGLALRIAMFRIGLDGRASFSEDLDLETIETDADSYQLAAFIGINF